MDFIQTFCVLDETNRFLYVGGDWDAFAAANEGEANQGSRITGKSLFDSVKGFDTRSFLNAAIFAVRDRQRQFVMDYRCDSPGIRRFMRLSVSPLRSGRVLMVHDFLHEEHLGDGGVAWLFAPDARFRKCSICCSVEFGEIWIDPFEATNPHPHSVTYAMCPECRRLVADKLGSAPHRPTFETKVVRFSATAAVSGR